MQQRMYITLLTVLFFQCANAMETSPRIKRKTPTLRKSSSPQLGKPATAQPHEERPKSPVSPKEGRKSLARRMSERIFNLHKSNVHNQTSEKNSGMRRSKSDSNLDLLPPELYNERLKRDKLFKAIANSQYDNVEQLIPLFLTLNFSSAEGSTPATAAFNKLEEIKQNGSRQEVHAAYAIAELIAHKRHPETGVYVIRTSIPEEERDKLLKALRS